MVSQAKRPIVALLDLISKKWILRMLWELDQGPCTFRQLQARCGDISPTTINQRLKELQNAHLIIKQPKEGYALSDSGQELVALFIPVNTFAKKWIETLP